MVSSSISALSRKKTERYSSSEQPKSVALIRSMCFAYTSTVNGCNRVNTAVRYCALTNSWRSRFPRKVAPMTRCSSGPRGPTSCRPTDLRSMAPRAVLLMISWTFANGIAGRHSAMRHQQSTQWQSFAGFDSGSKNTVTP